MNSNTHIALCMCENTSAVTVCKHARTIMYMEAQVPLEVRAENCQSPPEQVEELPTGTVAPSCVPGRHDATLEHQPQPEAATHVEDVVNLLQVVSDPMATIDIDPT